MSRAILTGALAECPICGLQFEREGALAQHLAAAECRHGREELPPAGDPPQVS